MADFAPGEHPMRMWGLPRASELERIVVVSPHLDDAVLGCGHFLASYPGTAVVTVFAGNPAHYPEPMREWDVQSGFAPGDDVMAVRRAEDHAAMASLDATPIHLDHVEYTYRPGDQPTPAGEIVDSLVDAIAPTRPTLVLAPFGLANPDHDMTHRACLLARDRLDSEVSWWCYEDTGYKHIPGMLAWRVATLFRRRLWPTPVCPPITADEKRKRDAIDCYPSQLRPLEEDWSLSAKLSAPAPEQFWRIEPPPDGWEALSDG
jgi:LmbE family N-acetylglucosaminyl deacetylase